MNNAQAIFRLNRQVTYTQRLVNKTSTDVFYLIILLGPFHGAIAVPSVTRCRCRRRGHRCAGGVRQWRQ